MLFVCALQKHVLYFVLGAIIVAAVGMDLGRVNLPPGISTSDSCIL